MYSMFTHPTDIAEVIDIVRNFKGNKSPGADEISQQVVKSSIFLSAKPLNHILNISMARGVFPDKLKIAKVIPIFKSEDKKLMNNDRPIFVLPVFSKIL